MKGSNDLTSDTPPQDTPSEGFRMALRYLFGLDDTASQLLKFLEAPKEKQDGEYEWEVLQAKS